MYFQFIKKINFQHMTKNKCKKFHKKKYFICLKNLYLNTVKLLTSGEYSQENIFDLYLYLNFQIL